MKPACTSVIWASCMEDYLRQNFRPATAAGYSRTRSGRHGGGGDEAGLDAPTSSADADAVSIAAPSSVGALETSMWSCGHFTLTLLHLVQGRIASNFDRLLEMLSRFCTQKAWKSRNFPLCHRTTVHRRKIVCVFHAGDAGVSPHAHLHDVQLVAVRGRRGRGRRRILPVRLEEDDRLRRVGPLPLTTTIVFLLDLAKNLSAARVKYSMRE